MEEEQTRLTGSLTRLSAIFALLLPLVISVVEYAVASRSNTGSGMTHEELMTVLSYIALGSTTFSSSIIYFGARRLPFRQSYILAVFPVAANVLAALSAINVLRASSGAYGLPASYIAAAYLRMAVLPFADLWLCGLWSKYLKNEALFVAVSLFVCYVLGSVTNWLVGGLLPTGPESGFVRSELVVFGTRFGLEMLVGAVGYALLWLLFRKKCKKPEVTDG